MSDNETPKEDEPVATVRNLKANDNPITSRPLGGATHTYVELEVSAESYAEVKHLLEQAGWDHAIMDDGAIDLSGIALTKAFEPPTATVITINGRSVNLAAEAFGDKISYEEILLIEGLNGNPSCVWHSDGRSGILAPGQFVKLAKDLCISVAHTGNA